MRAFGRSLSDFGSLSAAETKLLSCSALGEIASFGRDVPHTNDPLKLLRAELVRFLVLGGDTDAALHENGIKIHGAWLDGPLNLQGLTISTPIAICSSRLETIEARGAKLTSLNLAGSKVEGEISADGLQCENDFFLRDEFRISGKVRLNGAIIGGVLDCDNGRFELNDDNSIEAQMISVRGDVLMADGFRSLGTIILRGATIDGRLRCSGGTMESEHGDALDASDIVVRGPVFFGDGFSAKGRVYLRGARLGGLQCGGSFTQNTDGALDCSAVQIEGVLSLLEGFHADGDVRLHATRITGDLVIKGARFRVDEGNALICDRSQIAGDVRFERNLIDGRTSFMGMTIAGDFYCRTSELVSHTDPALKFGRTSLKGTFFFEEMKKIKGGVSFANFSVGVLRDDQGTWAVTTGARVLDGFCYQALASQSPVDDKFRSTWLEAQTTANGTPIFLVQPWDQLSESLLKGGHTAASRRIAIRKQDLLRRAGQLPMGVRPFHWLYGLLIGYGYRPSRLLLLTALIWFASACVFSVASQVCQLVDPCLIVPASGDIPGTQLPRGNPTSRGASPNNAKPNLNPYPFNSWIYAADVELPIINLGYKQQWSIRTSNDLGVPINEGVWLRDLFWFDIAFGWVAGALIAGQLASLLKPS